MTSKLTSINVTVERTQRLIENLDDVQIKKWLELTQFLPSPQSGKIHLLHMSNDIHSLRMMKGGVWIKLVDINTKTMTIDAIMIFHSGTWRHYFTKHTSGIDAARFIAHFLTSENFLPSSILY